MLLNLKNDNNDNFRSQWFKTTDRFLTQAMCCGSDISAIDQCVATGHGVRKV